MKLGRKKKAVEQSSEITARDYDVIRRPHVTEKTSLMSENNTVVFQVAGDATKPEIKGAIERVFKVKVEGVNTLNRKGKTKGFRGTKGKQNDIKKAMVTLAEGQTIEM